MNFTNALETIGRFTNTAVLSPCESFFTDESMTFFGSVKSDIAQEVGLYDDIADLNRLISLFKDPKVELDGLKIYLSETEPDAQKHKACFLTSDISLINKGSFDLKTQLEKTLSSPKVLTFCCSPNIIHTIHTSSSVIANSKVVLESKNGEVQFLIKDIDMLQTDSNSFRFTIEDISPERDFAIVLDASMFNKMPKTPSGFDFSIVYSSAVNSYRAVFATEELTIVTPTQLYQGA